MADLFRRILVPHDFSNHATAALKTAVRLVGSRGRLVVLHVVVPFTPVADIPPAGIAPYVSPDVLLSGATKEVGRAVKKAVPSSLQARLDVKVEMGDPAHTIVEMARGMDLIVMSTAGRSGLAHLLIGSVTEKVVRHSPIPVLTLRPEAARKTAKKRAR